MSVFSQAEKKKETVLGNRLRRLLRPSSVLLILAWVVLFGLLFYVQRFAKELSPFDPFDILKARTHVLQGMLPGYFIYFLKQYCTMSCRAYSKER